MGRVFIGTEDGLRRLREAQERLAHSNQLVSQVEIDAVYKFWDETYGVTATGNGFGVNLTKDVICELLVTAAKVR